MNSNDRLVVILGPTAAGKSELGMRLAERLSGEVVVCDSTQVYRGFDIGTSKVRRKDRRGIPHHLVDLVAPEEVFTAGEYRQRALEVLDDLRQRGKVPILTAGTGLYLRALLEGLADAPTRSEELRRRLRRHAEQEDSAHLHRILARRDPDAAARIAPRDTQKLIRAIEISILSGKSVTEVHRSGRTGLQGYMVTKIGLMPPRQELYARINQRVEAMLEAGWLEEVGQLVAAGIPATAKPFQFIGYPQLREQLKGKMRVEEAVLQIQRATRRYAKRQITWFRKESGVEWHSGFGEDPRIASAVLEHLLPTQKAPEL
ncbi:MAG: tRNA (adenosine(37)-N6)-dimethylallyltransferase MiaA [Candidatus Acidiferrales bacterium]